MAAQRDVAKMDFAIAATQIVRDTAFTVLIAEAAGAAASASFARTAASARSAYSAARSWQEVNALARVAAQYQTAANYSRLMATSAVGVAYAAINSNTPTELYIGLGASAVESGAGLNFQQVGFAIEISQAALTAMQNSGLTNEQAAGVVGGIVGSVQKTQATLDGRLAQALSACDEKYK